MYLAGRLKVRSTNVESLRKCGEISHGIPSYKICCLVGGDKNQGIYRISVEAAG